jgi:hypothetical protein
VTRSNSTLILSASFERAQRKRCFSGQKPDFGHGKSGL